MLHAARLVSRKPATLAGCQLASSTTAAATQARPASSTAGLSDDYLLHRSPVHTEFFQASLPSLKVPELNSTIDKYLKSQQPLLNDEEFANTGRLCQEFLKQDGPELQRLLQEYNRAESGGNFVSDFWFDMYLKDRRSVVLNHTPFMAFAAPPKPIEPLDRLTNMLYSSARYYVTYSNRVLKPEVFFLDPKLSEDTFYRRMKMLSKLPGHSRAAWAAAYLHKAFPLDMSQYPNLMASTRLPQPGKDALRAYPDSRHILVLRGGRLYSLDLLLPGGDDAGIVPAGAIRAQLAAILADTRPPADFPVGALTSADRDHWAEQRRQLEAASQANADALRTVDSALFVLCLDEELLAGNAAMCHAFLHSTDGGANRWWDKSLSLLANLPSGEFAVSFEHSWGDGVAVLRYFNEIAKDANLRPALDASSSSTSTTSTNAAIRRLDFDLDAGLKSAVAGCRDRLAARASDLDLDFWQFDGLGRSAAKRAGLSPDAVSQLAIQLAYYWLSGGATAATYESCSTAAFKRGRTETIRPATTATKAFCQLAAESSSSAASAGSLVKAMRVASEAHAALTKDAAMGKGWDRHLFALRCMADRRGGGSRSGSVPLFADPAYRRILDIVLSTSTLSSPALKIGGFGPVLANGFGIGYAIEEAGMGCVVTAYRSGGRSAAEFMACYRRACQFIGDALKTGA